MAEEEMTIFQKLKSMIVPVLFNILLPVFDVFSDCRIIILLVIGGFKCIDPDNEYDSCRDDPPSYCTSPIPYPDICEKTGDGFRCRNARAEYMNCGHYPARYCTSLTAFPGVCEKTGDGFRCTDYYHDEYHRCSSDPTSYCTSPTAFPGVCGERFNHPIFGLILFIPFLLNYIVSFITWWRLDNNKKFSFIFALINLYAPYGKSF